MSHLVLPPFTQQPGAKEAKGAELCLLSAATDGKVAVWTPLLPDSGGEGNTTSLCTSDSVESEERVEKCVHPLTVCQVHQSGINDLSIRQGQIWTPQTPSLEQLIDVYLSLYIYPVSDGFYLIATVGDDNALAVLGLTAHREHFAKLEVLGIEKSAHASSITGEFHNFPLTQLYNAS